MADETARQREWQREWQAEREEMARMPTDKTFFLGNHELCGGKHCPCVKGPKGTAEGKRLEEAEDLVRALLMMESWLHDVPAGAGYSPHEDCAEARAFLAQKEEADAQPCPNHKEGGSCPCCAGEEDWREER